MNTKKLIKELKKIHAQQPSVVAAIPAPYIEKPPIFENCKYPVVSIDKSPALKQTPVDVC